MIEIWLPITGFKQYMVSNHGRVKSTKRDIVLKPSISRDGYVRLCLWDRGKSYSKLMHRLVAYEFLEINLLAINHKNGNKLDNIFSNLEYVTNKENSNHAVKLGLIKSGEAHHLSKFSKDQIIYIREMFNQGVKRSEISKKLGCSWEHINRIIKKISRKYE